MDTALGGKVGQAELDALGAQLAQQWDGQFSQLKANVDAALQGKVDRTSWRTLTRRMDQMSELMEGSQTQLKHTFVTMGDLLNVLQRNFSERDERFMELYERFRIIG
jgi:hypothetical protein